MMVVLFNADLRIEDFKEQCPIKVYELTREFFEKSGYVGKFNVNHYGLVRRGFDRRCNFSRTGEFIIHYRDPRDDMTMREHFETFYFSPRFFSLEDERQRTDSFLEIASRNLELIEERDPVSRVVSQADYLGSAIPHSLGIKTPAGMHSLHYHMDDSMHFGVMQFFRPRKERNDYCLDVLKDYLFDLMLYENSLWDKLKFESEDIHFLNRMKLRVQKAAIKGSGFCRLHERLLRERFDEVERIPFLLKHLDFFGVNLVR